MTNKEFKKFFANSASEFRKNNASKLIQGSKYFNQIGSTQFEDFEYIDELNLKRKVLNELFASLLNNNPELNIQIFESPLRSEYRFKAEFVTALNLKFEPYNRMGQRKKGNFNWIVDLTDEYILLNNKNFLKVRDVFNKAIELKIDLYNFKNRSGLLRYLTIKGDKNLMLLITTTKNNEKINELSDYALNNGFNSVFVLENNSLTDTFDGNILYFKGKENIEVEFNGLKFLVGPKTFFQNNIFTFQLIVDYISNFIKNLNLTNSTLYDLYCGIGFLGINLSKYFKNVIGYEIVLESVNLATEIAKINNINNIEIHNTDLNKENFVFKKDSVVVVDPPRVGLLDQVNNLLNSNSSYIFYISCNPVTLKSDIIKLQQKYNLIDLKFFDCFALTEHIEGLAIFKKK